VHYMEESQQQQQNKKRRIAGGEKDLPKGARSSDQEKERSDIYAPLPRDLLAVLNEEAGCTRRQEAVSDLVASVIGKGHDTTEVWTQKVRDKVLALDNVKEPRSLTKREEMQRQKLRAKKRSKMIKAKEKREKNMLKMPEDALKYELYIPLHTMWKDYLAATLNNSKGSALTAKILKADMHGCCIKVIRSKCPSFVGLEGIVLLETERTFQIITRHNQFKGTLSSLDPTNWFVKQMNV